MCDFSEAYAFTIMMIREREERRNKEEVND
jgi:hypothetical protein